MKIKLLFVLVVLTSLFCASPAHFLANVCPQKSISVQEFGNPKALKRVLIGGVTSPFKETIVKLIVEGLIQDSVYVKTIRLKALKKEIPAEWNAVLILNTCMAWEINYDVTRYVRSFPEYGAFVVVTTSGDPDSCGTTKKMPKNIDALSTASENRKLPEVVRETLELLRNKIE